MFCFSWTCLIFTANFRYMGQLVKFNETFLFFFFSNFHYYILKALNNQPAHAFEPFTAVWLLYKPTRLTPINPTFSLHSTFVCFVWISEQAVIIFLSSNHGSVLRVTDLECFLRGAN